MHGGIKARRWTIGEKNGLNKKDRMDRGGFRKSTSELLISKGEEKEKEEYIKLWGREENE